MITCGVALCTPNTLECTNDVIEITKDTLETGIALVEENPLQAAVDALNLALALNYPICSSANIMKSNSLLFLMLYLAIKFIYKYV